MEAAVNGLCCGLRQVDMAEITAVVIRNASMHMLLGWFISTWASMHFFRYFTVKKQAPLAAVRLCCFMLMWLPYVEKDCGKKFLVA